MNLTVGYVAPPVAACATGGPTNATRVTRPP